MVCSNVCLLVVVVCDKASWGQAIAKENVIVVRFSDDRRTGTALADLEEIIRLDETTNNPQHGMSKVKYSRDEMS